MAYKYREEIVGKRFLSVSGFTKLKLGKITEWGWRAGVIRAASHKDNKHKDLQVLVEYDDVEWHRREWISIYKDSLFHFFMVEQGLVWSDRRDPYSSGTVLWPALTFSSLVSSVDLSAQAQPVEFLLDRELAFKDYTRLQPFQEWDSGLAGVRDYPELRAEVRRWAELQDGQRILLTTPSVLVGYRVEVYRAEGTTQWYTAVIVGYNEATRDLTVTDDTVLEEHNEDPSLVQMRLIGDGVVESIMRGENVGITPRRSRSALLHTHHHQQPSSRVGRGSSGLAGTVTTNSGASRNHHTGNPAAAVVHRKQRVTRPSTHVSEQQQPPLIQQPDPDNKGTTVAKAQRKRKSSENDASSVTKPPRPSSNNNNAAYSNKEDLENKQGRKRNSYTRGAKKKVLEEANNSKLRHVQIRVEDCLQNGQRSGTLSAICRRQSHESANEPPPPPPVDDGEEEVNVHEQEQPSSATVPVVSTEDTSTPLHDETSNSSSVQLVQLEDEEDDEEEEEVIVEQSIGSAGVTSTTTSATTLHNDKGERVRTPASSTPSPAVPLVEVEAVSEEDDCVIVAEELHPPVQQPVTSAASSRTVVIVDDTANSNGNSAVCTGSASSVVSGGTPAGPTTTISSSVVSGVVVVERGASVLLRECDDDGPLSSSSPFSRMELSDGSGTALLRFPDDRSDSGVSSLRSGSCASGDERSGSRSSALSSSDEPQQLHNGIQSTSSSSSSSSSLLSATISSNNNSHQHINHRSPSLYVPTTSSSAAAAAAAAAASEAVRVWRDPSLLLESEPHVRHIHSVQHQSLLMSHPAVPASSAPSPSSAAVVATSTPSAAAQAAAAAAAAAVAVHYPSVVPPPPPLLSPHPMHHHAHAVPPHHLAPPPGIYSQLPEMLWKQRYAPLPVGAAHLLGPQPAHPAAEELIERERVYVQDRDRLIRERREQEVREMEKQQHKEREKERERMERERERQEREKMEREREREKQVERERQDRIEREQERERQEKQRAEQAVHKHFEESLRLAHQKQFVDSLQRERSNMATWNLISLPPPPRGSAAAEEERKRAEQEHQQREQQHRQMAASERFRQEQRERAAFYAMNSQRSPNIPSKAEYPPPAHSRVSSNIKSNDKMNVGHTSLPKAEPNFSLFGYPAYQPPGFVTHESKVKVEQHHKQQSQSSGLIVNKSSSSAMQSDRDSRDLVLSNPPPLISEMKGGAGGGSSVIVKHEVKSPHHLEPKVSVAHSPSPKLRGADMMSHYIPTTAASQQHKAAGMYEYRSPTQSPHHLQHPHTPSPHHHMVEPQNLGKSHPPPSHHRSNSGSSGGSGQLPSPHAMHQRQSPHMHSQSSPHPSSAEARYRSAAAAADAQMYAAAAGGKSAMSSAYSYLPQTTMGATAVPSHYALAVSSGGGASTTGSSSKPKVSSPAPPHIYGKPNAGIVTGIPVCRIQEVTPPSNPIPLTSKPPLPSSVSPSPYQQVSQYHPPHMHQSAMSAALPPPAHHSSRTTNIDPRAIYDRNMYASSTVPGGMSAKPLMQHHGTSPPTATAAPSRISHSPHLTHNMPQQMPMSMQHQSPAVQTQPLDLGVSSDRSSNRDELSSSPKRKGTPLSHPIGGPLPLDVKKRRIESPSHIAVSAQTLSSLHGGNHASGQQPQLARVSEPSPLIASAATTITTVVNTAAYRTSANTIIISQSHPSVLNEHGHIPSTQQQQQPAPTDMSHTSASVSSVPTISNVYTDSTSKLIVSTPPSTTSNNSAPPTLSVSPVSVSVENNSSPVPSATPVVISAPTATVDQQPPSTPVKVALTPSVVDSEKSNSPGPTKTSTTTTSNYPVRHLKKAWLQRHTGEDVEDTTGVKGSGTCVTLPIPNVNHSNNTPAKETSSVPPVTSLHNIGSMAVNSINKTKTLSNKGNGRKGNSSKDTAAGPLNGHGTDPSKGADDSSSSDQERGRKSPPKRKPPKVKRKKGGGGGVKKTSAADDSKKRKGGSVVPSSVASESGSDSDKESGSEKDSDSGASTNQASGAGTTGTGGKKATNGGSTNTTNSGGGGASKDKEPRKRGRRPKSSKNDKGEEPRNKKSRDEPSLPQRDPFRKPPVGQLKKTGESFLQDGPCFEVAPKLAKCRECRWTPNQRSKNMPNIFCRFYAFRRLRYTKNGQLAIAGFSDPHKDASEEDLKLWLPLSDNPPPDLDLEMSRLLLHQVGDHFCDLLVQERDALAEHMSEDKTIAWKRVVQGVREMCDVCETTLFNFHWACGKCGFVVCLDCYKGRKNGTVKIWGEPGKDRDEFSWLQCTNRQPHEQEKLMLTQIIAGDSLQKLGRRTHEFRELWGIPQFCGCPMSKDSKSINGAAYKDIIKSLIKGELNGIKIEKKEDGDSEKSVNGISSVKEEKNSPLNWLADVALSNEDKKEECSSDSDGDKEGNFSTLRELLIRPAHKSNGSRAASPANTVANPNNNGLPKNSKKSRMETLDEVISSVIEDTVHKSDELMHDVKPMELKHFVRRYNWQTKGREPLPIRIMTLTESKILYPNTPHSWLCDGKLLRLTDPNNAGNYRIFQDQWKRGQPVIVSDISRNLDMDLWHPDSFIRDFGDEKNDLINCMTGKLVPNQAMSKFWEGFEHFSKRLKDERGNPMLLKLKDWPPGEDFAELMPSRFNDLMRVLPLSEYTHRSGRLNLASRLPECFVRPDLGPKMYNAYGSALYPTKGTTNLHLDISDAVNVMVYVGIPKDGDNDEHIKEAFRAIDEAGCDILTRRRVRDKGELPGALWHIYNARDADKIRDLLNKVALEKGERLEPHHDPIHDQSGYLDGPLRERLYKEYGVEGYAIVQCLGDAVFIPAGAPHQVRNLHNCIKVAEDFVSPENVSHCFHLTQEFRELSDTHTNHEDKLQIKNIIYHTVKDSLSVLSGLLQNHTVKTEVEDGLLDACGTQNSVGSHHSGASSSDSNSPSGSPASHDTDSKEPA